MTAEYSDLSNAALQARSLKTAMPCYGDNRIALVKGKGTRVWDADGREYLDMLAGIAVACLGHAHPVIRDTLCAQADVSGSLFKHNSLSSPR